MKKITSDIRNLEQFPASGVALGEVIDITTDYCYLFSENNYVFYRLEFDKIRIVRVLNERQEYMKHLFEDMPDIERELLIPAENLLLFEHSVKTQIC